MWLKYPQIEFIYIRVALSSLLLAHLLKALIFLIELEFSWFSWPGKENWIIYGKSLAYGVVGTKSKGCFLSNY